MFGTESLHRSVDPEWWVWLLSSSGHFVLLNTLHYSNVWLEATRCPFWCCSSGSLLLLGHLWLQLRCMPATFVCRSDCTVTPFVWWLLCLTVLVVCCCFCHSWFICFFSPHGGGHFVSGSGTHWFWSCAEVSLLCRLCGSAWQRLMDFR